MSEKGGEESRGDRKKRCSERGRESLVWIWGPTAQQCAFLEAESGVRKSESGFPSWRVMVGRPDGS